MTIKTQPATSAQVSPRPSAQAFPRLGLHVINAGYGESIVLELPGNRWGVVDCYAPQLSQPSRNPTLQFLRNRSVETLEFLALTHPHKDHYHGLKDLLDHLTVKAFWWFAGVSSGDLARLVNGLRVEAYETRDRDRQLSARYLDRIFRTVIERRNTGTLQTTQMSDFKPLFPLPFGGEHPAESVIIHALAPQTDTVQRYQEKLHSCFEDETLKRKLPALDQNQISAALLIEYGKTRIILGGDVETESWQEVLARVAPSRLKAHAVKVSHHGSQNGYCTGLWPLLCEDSSTIAVIAPSRRHSLPNAAAIEHIRAAGAQTACTCLPALTFATGPYFDGGSYEGGVQLALRAVFPTFQVEKHFPLGTCSFWFDAHGKVVNTALTSSAGFLQPV